LDVAEAAEVVLGKSGPDLTLYTERFEDYSSLFPEYRYHFLNKSKPSMHLMALDHIESSVLKRDMPPVLAEILDHIASSVKPD